VSWSGDVGGGSGVAVGFVNMSDVGGTMVVSFVTGSEVGGSEVGSDVGGKEVLSTQTIRCKTYFRVLMGALYRSWGYARRFRGNARRNIC